MISHSSTQHSTTQGPALAVSSWCLRGARGAVVAASATRLSYRGVGLGQVQAQLRAHQLGFAGAGVAAIEALGTGKIAGFFAASSMCGSYGLPANASGTPVAKRLPTVSIDAASNHAITRFNAGNDPEAHSGADPGR